MLLSDLSSKNSLRVYWVLGLAVGDDVAAGCGAKFLLMSMTLSGVTFTVAIRTFQSSASRTKIIDQWPLIVIAGLALPSLTPFSGCPCFVASRTYQVNAIPVDLIGGVFGGVPPLVNVRKPFLNGLPTGDWPLCRNKNRVTGVKCGNSGGIVVVYSLSKRLLECEDLLGCLWIRQVFLLGVNRQSKTDWQSYEGSE